MGLRHRCIFVYLAPSKTLDLIVWRRRVNEGGQGPGKVDEERDQRKETRTRRYRARGRYPRLCLARSLSATGSWVYGESEGAHDTIDVGLNILRGDFTVLFKDIPCFERQFIAENRVIPRPRNAS